MTLFNNFNREHMELKNNSLFMEFEVPGFDKKEIKMSVEGQILEILAENEVREFTRKYKINDSFDVGKTIAELKNGILTLEIPKYENKKAKQIEIKLK